MSAVQQLVRQALANAFATQKQATNPAMTHEGVVKLLSDSLESFRSWTEEPDAETKLVRVPAVVRMAEQALAIAARTTRWSAGDSVQRAYELGRQLEQVIRTLQDSYQEETNDATTEE